MRNFAVFLFMANILWWGWVLMHAPDSVTPVKETAGDATFVQSTRKLHFLAEVKPDAVVVSGEEVAESRSEPVTGSVGEEPGVVVASQPLTPWCGESGMLADVKNVPAFLDSWSRLQGVGEAVQMQIAVSSTWWVHLPPFASEAEARKKLTELQEKKIDSYYMRSGDLSGGISLGVFSRQQSALTVQNELLKKGYKTEIREIPRTEARTQLRLRLEDGSKFGEAAVQELLARFQQFALHEIPCR